MHLVKINRDFYCRAGVAATLLVAFGCADNSVAPPNTKISAAIRGPEKISAVVEPAPGGIELGPAVLHQNLSVAAKLLSSGQFLDAEIVLRTLLKEQPNCARAEFLLGVTLLKQKQYAKARPLL